VTHAELIAAFCQLSWDRGLYVHYCGDGRRCEGPGFPDLLIAGPHGAMWREVKSAAAPQLRADQKAWIRMLNLPVAGGVIRAAVWTQADLDDGLAAKELDALT
jgi:hypothetical protein